MIRKQKICKECKLPKYIFAKGMCQYCYGKAKFKPIERGGRVKSVSEQQKAKLAKYYELRDEYLLAHPNCERCGATPVDLHHMAGRIGENLYKWFCSLCRNCHNWVHLHIEEAKKEGFLK